MKEKIDQVYNILKRIPVRTYVSLVLVTVAVINYALLAAGKPIINLGEAEVTYAVNTLLSLLAIGYGVWKNNSVTEYAVLTDSILYMLRDGKVTREELEQFIADHKSPETPTEDVAKIENVETTEATDEEVKG